MAHARLTYFSGTGNTRWVARRLGLGLRNAGYEIDEVEIGRLIPIRSRRPAPAHDVELDVFLFPVFAFALPHLVRRFLKRLPRAPLKPAAVLAVVGDIYHGRPGHRRLLPGYAGGSLSEARKILERRGYVLFASASVGLPASFTQLVPAPPAAEREEIATKAAATIAGLARSFARKEGGHRPFAPANRLWVVPVRIAFRLFGRRLAGKLYVADASCAGCGHCAKRCPAGTIRIVGGRPRWGWQCEACQRCMNGCPQSAIQTSPARSLLLGAASVLPYNRVFHLDALWGRIGFLGEWGSRAFWLGSWLASAAVALLVVDGLLSLAERPAGLRRFLAWSHTRRYPRYLGPGGPPGPGPGGPPGPADA